MSFHYEITCPATCSSAVASLAQYEDAGRGVEGGKLGIGKV